MGKRLRYQEDGIGLPGNVIDPWVVDRIDSEQLAPVEAGTFTSDASSVRPYAHYPRGHNARPSATDASGITEEAITRIAIQAVAVFVG